MSQGFFVSMGFWILDSLSFPIPLCGTTKPGYFTASYTQIFHGKCPLILIRLPTAWDRNHPYAAHAPASSPRVACPASRPAAGPAAGGRQPAVCVPCGPGSRGPAAAAGAGTHQQRPLSVTPAPAAPSLDTESREHPWKRWLCAKGSS